MRKLSTLLLLLLATVFPASSAAQAQSDDWPRLEASRLVTADGAPAPGEPVWLFVDRERDYRHAVFHAVWSTTTNARGRFVLRAPYRGRIRQAAELNGGWTNFELVAGAEGSSFWYSGFPAYWNGSGWDVETGALPRRIPPAL